MRAALCLGLACAVAACAPKPPARRPRMPDVVVIVLDAVRADRFGCLGNDRGLTPFLDSWAERSVVFHRAYSAASYTVASIASLLTSRLPSQHGVEWFGSVLSPDALTFPEVLDARRFQPAASTGNLLFRFTRIPRARSCRSAHGHPRSSHAGFARTRPRHDPASALIAPQAPLSV